jgi:hypothetical protein
MFGDVFINEKKYIFLSRVCSLLLIDRLILKLVTMIPNATLISKHFHVFRIRFRSLHFYYIFEFVVGNIQNGGIENWDIKNRNIKFNI